MRHAVTYPLTRYSKLPVDPVLDLLLQQWVKTGSRKVYVLKIIIQPDT